jgi:putative ABC transport system ATP-binding protein
LTESLRFEDIAVTLGDGTAILDLPALDIPAGQCLGISGPSGAGKTTLVQVLAGLCIPARGRVMWGDTDLTRLNGSARDAWRRRTIGLVFQDFALIPDLSAFDNIVLSAGFDHWRVPVALHRRARELIESMGLGALAGRRAGVLSRGEQQRVAVARALLHDPAVLIADEPTASLDCRNGTAIAGLLIDAARGRGSTLITVSHDSALLGRMDRVIRLDHGRMVEEERR